jgi:hypothetical protein
MAKTKSKKNNSKKHEQAVVEAVAETATETKKKKKYQRSVGVRTAGDVAKFLVLNAKKFRSSYEGDALTTIRVDQEDKGFLDELLDRLEPK